MRGVSKGRAGSAGDPGMSPHNLSHTHKHNPLSIISLTNRRRPCLPGQVSRHAPPAHLHDRCVRHQTPGHHRQSGYVPALPGRQAQPRGGAGAGHPLPLWRGETHRPPQRLLAPAGVSETGLEMRGEILGWGGMGEQGGKVGLAGLDDYRWLVRWDTQTPLPRGRNHSTIKHILLSTAHLLLSVSSTDPIKILT